MAVVLLPTALRPPPDQQNATASFSPDAPPDESPEMILQTIRQAQSSTAGRSTAFVEAEEIEVGPPPPPPPRRRAVRGRCFGDPPRQTESLYSALCVPAWTGADNGGATYRGVTANEIKVVVQSSQQTTPEGPVEREFRETDTESIHHLKVWQAYFNDRFEFFGRFLQFHVLRVSGTDEDQARAKMQEAAALGAFAYIPNGESTAAAAAAVEASRLGIVNFVPAENPVDFYKQYHPFTYGFSMDSWQLRFMAPELICKQWQGRPPGELNAKADPTFDYNAPRKFGLIIYQDVVRKGARKMYEDNLAKCGGKLWEVVEYNLNDNQQALADAAAKMKAAGVTTIIFSGEGLGALAVSSAAERIQYQPEYIGVTGLEGNGTGRNLNDNQANHWVMMSGFEIPRSDADKDWFRAYKEIDPDGEPASTWFRDLQQLAGGIQHAGTNLTPQTFWEALARQPCRTPNPEWSIGGCYKKPDPTSDLHYMGDYTYADYMALGWFDHAGRDPGSSSAGAWCYVYHGRRFKYGEMPSEPIPWRDKSQCMTTPERGQLG